jgi:hypothetical protein
LAAQKVDGDNVFGGIFKIGLVRGEQNITGG